MVAGPVPIIPPQTPGTKLRVIAARSPVSLEVADVQVEAGGTLAAIVAAQCPDPVLQAHAVVTLSDAAMLFESVAVPRAHWGRVRPKPGVVVTVRVRAGKGGGGGGKSPLRTILTIAVIAASFYVGGLGALEFGQFTLGSETLFAGQILGRLAVGIVGQLVVDAIAPPPAAQLSNLTQGPVSTRTSPTLSITGIRNRANPFGVVPQLMGDFRIFPTLAAKPFTEIVGDDQFYRALLDFGPEKMRLSDLRLGSTPFENFPDINYQLSWTDIGYALPTLFTNAIEQDDFSVKVTQAGGAITLETRDGADEISVDITFQGLVRFDNSGNRQEQSVDLLIEYRAAGSSDAFTVVPPENDLGATDFDGGAYLAAYPDIAADSYFGTRPKLHYDRHGRAEGRMAFYLSVKRHRFTAASENAVRRGLRWTPPTKGRFEIRFTRNTDDNTSTRVRNDSFITAIRTIRHVTPVNVDGHMLMAVRFKASDSTQGLLDQVNAVGHSILPVWDGAAFTDTETRHPAWASLHVLRGPNNLDPIPDSRIQLDDFKVWADATPTATFDGVFDFPGTVKEAFNAIAAQGGATIDERDGKYTILRDDQQTVPVQLFTPRNSWGFSAERGIINTPHALRVRFVNPLTDWKTDEVVVYQPGYNASNAKTFEGLELFGEVDPANAALTGIRRMREAMLRPWTYNLAAELDALVCRRGLLVNAAYDVPGWGAGWGRIVSVTMDSGEATGLVLDDIVTMIAGKNYAVSIRLSTGVLVAASVVTAAGDTDTLAFTQNLTGAQIPAAGDMAAFGEATRVVKALKVRSMDTDGDYSARLKLVDAAPELYVADPAFTSEHNTSLNADPFADAPGAVTDLDIVESVDIVGNQSLATPEARWRPAPGSFGAIYEVHRRNGDRYELAATVTAPRHAFAPAPKGAVLDIVIVAVAPSGRKLTVGESTGLVHTLTGNTIPPYDVTRFQHDRLPNGRSRFTWVMNDRWPNVAGFELRRHPGHNTHFESAQRLHDGIWPSSPFETTAFGPGQWTVLVKAVDSDGLKSESAAVIVFGLGDAEVRNIVEIFDQRALGWTGDKVNATVVAGDLLANDTTGAFYATDITPFYSGEDSDAMYGAPSDPMYSGNEAPMYTDDAAPMYTDQFDEIRYRATIKPVHGGRLDIAVTGDGPIIVNFRRAFPDPMYTDDDAPFYTGDADPMYAAAGGYFPFLSPVDIAAEEYNIEIVGAAGSIRPRLVTATLTVDAPDIQERFNDVAVAASGSRLTLTKSFDTVKVVELTLQDDGGAAVTARVLGKSAQLGPLIQCFDVTNQPIGGSIDAVVTGI